MTNITDCCTTPQLPLKVIDEYDLKVTPTGFRTLLICATCLDDLRPHDPATIVLAGNSERWYLA